MQHWFHVVVFLSGFIDVMMSVLISVIGLCHTVTLRYNAVVGRHLLRPPYKRGALWDPVDLFDTIIPRRSKGRPSCQGLKLNLCNHKPFISEHTVPTVPMLAWLNIYYIANRVETNKWTKTR